MHNTSARTVQREIWTYRTHANSSGRRVSGSSTPHKTPDQELRMVHSVVLIKPKTVAEVDGDEKTHYERGTSNLCDYPID